MARRTPRKTSRIAEMNLTPILNIVMILIPLLLLSVVFEQMGVINVSSPRTISHAPPEITDPPANLTVSISTSGYILSAEGVLVPADESCPDAPSTAAVTNRLRSGQQGGGARRFRNRATICTRSEVDVAQRLERARELRRQFDQTGDRALLSASNRELTEVVSAYDQRELYNHLAALKAKYPEETRVTVSAEPDMPFEILTLTMDTARQRLDKSHYESAEDFAAAAAAPGESLFVDVNLAVAQ